MPDYSGVDRSVLEQLLAEAQKKNALAPNPPPALNPPGPSGGAGIPLDPFLEPPAAPNDRQKDLASERTKRKAKGKKRANDADAEIEALVAQSDEQASRRHREIRWEHFLYGEMKGSRTESVLKKICGDNVGPDSKVYDEERRAALALHRRFQSETLANALKFCRRMTENDSESTGPWAELVDLRIAYSDAILLEKVGASWSWERFYVVWHWFRDYVDGEASKKLAKYYCQQIWQWTIVETIRFIRIEKQNPREGADAQKTRIARYVALPSHANFTKVRRDMFVERSPSLKGSRGAKKQKIDPAVTLSHMTMAPPPDSDDDDDDDEQ